MTNPYVPNTASIPNILFDYWMNRLTPAEFKVLMCIARKTYGWGKAHDLISIKQIENMTGLHRSGIIKNIEKLVELGLVNKIKSKTSDGDDAPNRFEINVYCVEGGSLHTRLPVVDSVDPGVVDSVDPQNTLYTKPTIQKNTPPNPQMGECVEDLKNSKKSKIPDKPDKPKKLHGTHVKLNDEEYSELQKLYTEAVLKDVIEELNDYVSSVGKKYKCYFSTIKNWMRRRNERKAAGAKYMQHVDRRCKDKNGNPVKDDFKDNLF